LSREKKEVVLVSSGAIFLGMMTVGIHSRPQELASLQAAAAVGQNELMNAYRKFFDKLGITCGQVLLTWEDFNDRKRYLNAKNTLLTLLSWGAVPVINENDTVSTDEIRFGDNDRLSALVSSIISADLLIILSDIDGLLDKDKTVIPCVESITPAVKALACPSDKKTCAGGMITKIEAARIAVDSGIPCVITNGRKKNIILSTVRHPGESGTIFLPKKSFLKARMRWLAFGSRVKGKITIDDGAREALLKKKSLLSVGVNAVEGVFLAGDVVNVLDLQGNEFARGKVNVSSRTLEKNKGKRYTKEIIHRDNIVVF
ncbi:MAG: glutamate 5-kinase, partial [Candidatus Omnitrophica bacterium]|nr:glutamate 5-kinase [Candidatus Omnitrophota bacterium]